MTEEPSTTSASLGNLRGRPVGRELVCPFSSGFGTTTAIALPMLFFPTTYRQGGPMRIGPSGALFAGLAQASCSPIDDALVPQPSPGLLFGAGLIALLSQRRYQHAWSH